MKVALMKHIQTSVMFYVVHAVGFRKNSMQNLNPISSQCTELNIPERKTTEEKEKSSAWKQWISALAAANILSACAENWHLWMFKLLGTKKEKKKKQFQGKYAIGVTYPVALPLPQRKESKWNPSNGNDIKPV